MLRAIVVFLLLANAAFFAWTHNWLAAIGLPAELEMVSNTTPVALLRPESIHLLTAQQLEAEQQLQEQKQAKAALQPLAQVALAAAQQHTAPAPTPAPAPAPAPILAQPEIREPAVPTVTLPAAPRICKSVASLTDEQMAVIRPLLAPLPSQSWRVEETVTPGRWMVFWGEFDDELVFAAKRAQLEAKRLDFAPVRNTPQGTGFSLGRFSSEAAAKQESARLEQRGINGLRVVQERAGMPAFALQLSDFSNLPPATRNRLISLLQGKPLRNCV